MNIPCIAPHEIADWELEAYVDGEAPTHVRQHIEKCAYCTAQVQARRRWQQALTRRLYRFDCPTAEELLDFCWHDLPPRAAQRIAAHLTRCSLCRQEVAQLRAVQDSAEAPPAVAQEAAPPLREQLEIIIARFIPPAPTLAPALRGLPRGALYETAAGDISITLLGPDDQGTYMLDGQILAPALETWSGAVVRLVDSGGVEQQEVAVDETGRFTFTQVPAGAWHLRLRRAQQEIRVPLIEV